MNNKALNITNGEYFNKHFIEKHGEQAVPFCEAMMDGDVISDICSQEFISLRAKALLVSENEYKSKMYVYDALKTNEYDSICLWFGKDTFCQVNLLTLLAYLEQIQYNGELKLNYIDDETFEILESDINIVLGGYRKIYEDVLISKSLPENLGVLCARAIDLYFDYHADNGALTGLIKANFNKDRTDLICLLVEFSKDYGLSYLQAGRLIDSVLLH